MITATSIASQLTTKGNDLLQLLHTCGGYYECPKGSDGKRLGPLVGYAGKYDAGAAGEKQFVGDVYANFSAMEQFPVGMSHAAKLLLSKIEDSITREEFDCLCGAPEGGKAIANLISVPAMKRYIYPEKKITALATPDQREQSVLVWKRHEVRFGEKIVIVEDVSNNFSTTADMIRLISSAGGIVVAIASLLNRSLTVDDMYNFDESRIPVIALVRKKIEQHRQDDPAVAADIESGNVVWKPKDDWDRLMVSMQAN